MKQLPTEVFNRIMVLLPFGDKVELMTVCRKWANTIKACSLFQTIRISSKQQLHRIVEKIEGRLHEAKQAECLAFDLNMEPNFDLVHFFNQFPNLRFIFMYNSRSTQFQAMTTQSENKYIENIVDMHGCAMVSYFLASNKYSYLKQLYIGVNVLDSSIPCNFGNLYMNLPMLDKLNLNGIEVTFDELETLHSFSPSLRSLYLLNLQIKDTDLPALIQPTLLTTDIFHRYE